MVYVVQESTGKNFLPAASYGEIEVLLQAQEFGFSPGPMFHRINKKLQHFCDEDYLLLIGDPVAIGIATAVAARWNQGRVKVLRWDRQERTYYPMQLELQ